MRVLYFYFYVNYFLKLIGTFLLSTLIISKLSIWSYSLLADIMGLLLETRRKGYLLLNTQDLCSGGERSRYSNKVLRVGKTCVVGPSQHQTVIEGYLRRKWKDIFLLLSAHCNLWQMARERKIGLMKSTTQTTDNTLSLLLWGTQTHNEQATKSESFGRSYNPINRPFQKPHA